MGRLDGKVALITGGTTGIGEASAKLFRDEGATVIVTGVSEANVARAAAAGFDAIACDQADLAAIDALMAGVRQRHGRIDCLFVNAGGGPNAPLGKVTSEFFDASIALNLKGVLFTVQAALPLMPDGGSIVLTSSVAAHSGLPGGSIYSAAKAGVRAFSRAFAAELMPRRIRVNTLTPGMIDTPIFDKFEVPREQITAHLQMMVPMRRPGLASEAAAVALFLACDDSGFMTGAEIKVSGGQTDL